MKAERATFFSVLDCAFALVAAGLWLVTSADLMIEDPVEAATAVPV